jgi:hypothetical protein
MRSFQFWILVLGATLVSLLMMKNVFIARAFNREQRQLVQNQQMADAASQYETAWKTLAMHIYEKSKADPSLAEILKNAAVQVRSETTPAPEAGATPAASPSPMSSVPPKAPGTP